MKLLKQIILKLKTYPNKLRNEIKWEIQTKNLEHNRKTEFKKLKLTKRKLRIIDETKNNSFSNLNN